jgi:hypothetical protein
MRIKQYKRQYSMKGDEEGEGSIDRQQHNRVVALNLPSMVTIPLSSSSSRFFIVN